MADSGKSMSTQSRPVLDLRSCWINIYLDIPLIPPHNELEETKLLFQLFTKLASVRLSASYLQKSFNT